jgi:hypothetical protein
MVTQASDKMLKRLSVRDPPDKLGYALSRFLFKQCRVASHLLQLLVDNWYSLWLDAAMNQDLPGSVCFELLPQARPHRQF